MAEIFVILIFFAVILLTAVIFVVWFFATIGRVFLHGIWSIFSPSRLPPAQTAGRGITCTNARCRAVNPGTARFCRRCGSEMPQVQQVNVRRAAMW